jgi:hypothetical protein
MAAAGGFGGLEEGEGIARRPWDWRWAREMAMAAAVGGAGEYGDEGGGNS